MVSLFCCAVWVGLDGPLATVTEPSLLGSVRTIDSLSLLATVQPAGTLTVSPSLESVVAPSGVAVGEPIGLGVPPAGVGLGRSAIPPPEVLEGLRLPMIARAAVRAPPQFGQNPDATICIWQLGHTVSAKPICAASSRSA